MYSALSCFFFFFVLLCTHKYVCIIIIIISATSLVPQAGTKYSHHIVTTLLQHSDYMRKLVVCLHSEKK